MTIKKIIFSTFFVLVLINIRAAESTASAPEEILRAIALWEMSNPPADEVEKKYRTLLAEYPEFVPAMIALGDFLTEHRRFHEAEDLWLKAERLEPDNPEPLNRLGGYQLQQKGDIKKAADYFEKAVALAPNVAQYHIDLATVLSVFRHDLHRSDEKDSESVLQRALAHYRRAVELQPEDIRIAQMYAEAFYTMSKPDWNEALKAWEHATSLMPKKDFGYLHLARISLQLHDPEKARAYLDEVQNTKFLKAKERLQKQADKASGLPSR